MNGEELLRLEREKERSDTAARPCSVQRDGCTRDFDNRNVTVVTAGVSL